MTELPGKNECYSFVIRQFLGDTIKLLDRVLSDDETDPAYSAVMVYNRLYAYLMLASDQADAPERNRVCGFLAESGYGENDIRRFLSLKEAEESYYRGELLYAEG